MLCFVLVKIFIIFGFILKQCKRLECSFFSKRVLTYTWFHHFLFFMFLNYVSKKTHLIKVKWLIWCTYNFAFSSSIIHVTLNDLNFNLETTMYLEDLFTTIFSRNSKDYGITISLENGRFMNFNIFLPLKSFPFYTL
jgi:hypothetical protein